MKIKLCDCQFEFSTQAKELISAVEHGSQCLLRYRAGNLAWIFTLEAPIYDLRED